MPANTSKNKLHDSQLLAVRAAQVQGGAARAAVLGVNDGLVSTVCLVLGVAAASGGSRQAVLIAGFAGLIAGALSMASGEWISVRAQVELFQGILKDLKKMVRNDLQILKETLQENFIKSGMKPSTAKAAAQDMSKKDSHFAEIYAIQVLGLNPDELGSPWLAAVSSFALFTAGSLIALLPWFFIGGDNAVLMSIVGTGMASILVGVYIAKSSGRNWLYGGIRQFLIVLAASTVTYGIGHIFGVAIN